MPTADYEALASQLETTGRYQVLRRLEPRRQWHEPDATELKTAVVVDVETTGLDPDRDAIIQFCGIPFTYATDTGTIYEVGQPLTGFDDPGRPIPALITALTGITDADVAGQRLDEAAIGELLGPAVLVIAHNAGFDRPFIDSRLPGPFRDKHWACSVEGIPWQRYGFKSRSLEFLLYRRHQMFFEAHSAEADCQALLHALAVPFEDTATPMGLLLEGARRRTVRIWAIGSPIEQKDMLKARRYRWNGGQDGRAKAWYCELPEGEESEAELAWLRENIYSGREGWKLERVDPRSRYAHG
ncbi:MAG: 3'-5' exonuclease [Gemmatimonadota bacterium]|nr:3'-5' exonuclease [Gemmatimonadota bacterium]